MRTYEVKDLLLPGLMVLCLVLAWTTSNGPDRTLYMALAVLFGAQSAHRYTTPDQQANEQD